MKQKTKILCNKCGYTWETKSTLIMICCPSCGRKVINQRVELKDD